MFKPTVLTDQDGPADDPDAGAFAVAPGRLEGEVRVSGAKNSVLRLLAATLLTADDVVLLNHPATLGDAQVQIAMLEALGKRCTGQGDTLTVREAAAPPSRLDWPGRSIRNTLLVLGALVARTGAGRVPLPGGCRIGAKGGERGYDLHEMLLERLGARVWTEGDDLCAEAPDGGLAGTDIHLPLRSTGATENALLCGCLARGTTRIWNPHIRPEILDLIAFLRRMGAEIRVFGQEHIEVTGQTRLNGARHRVIPDNIEAMTWLVASVITCGDLEIHDFPTRHLEVPLIHLKAAGARLFQGEDSLIVRGGQPYPVEISTGPYPGINSDMQPLFAVYGACARGESRIVDLRFPGRYGYVDELARMGMEQRIDGNLLVIRGGRRLHGAEVTALDLRAGIALVLAGLTATGETLVRAAWQVERGYDQFIAKMQSVGGQVRRVSA